MHFVFATNVEWLLCRHMPSSVFLILIPAMPKLPLAILLLFLRQVVIESEGTSMK